MTNNDLKDKLLKDCRIRGVDSFVQESDMVETAYSVSMELVEFAVEIDTVVKGLPNL